MEKYYWIIILGVLALVYVLLIVKQKRDQKNSVEKLNTYKVGDKVITHIGIYGKIKRIYNTTYGKTCVLEIGNTNKIDVEMDMRFIASLDEKTALPDDPKPTEEKQENLQDNKKDDVQKELSVNEEDKSIETNVEETDKKKEEKKVKSSKKTTSKKTTNNKKESSKKKN